MKPLLFIIAISSLVAACVFNQVNRDNIISDYSKVVVYDGVDDNEMKIIAQNYLLTVSDEPCKSEVTDLRLERPFIKCGWIEHENDHGCYVGFSKKGLFKFAPLYIKVSKQTGKASCAGHLILK